MNQLKDVKKIHEEIPIPKELSERVQTAIKNSEKNRKTIGLKKRQSILKISVGTAAAVAVTFTVLLNTSTTFAKNASEIPIIGAVARVLTFRSYEKDEGDFKISVDIPSVEMISKDNNGLEASINEEIYRLCEQYANEAIQRAEEYKKAFIDTGGTEKEWKEHNIEIRVWYEIKSQTEHYLSLAVMGNENWNSAGSETKYYNIDLDSKKIVSLEDLLGENHIKKADESIKKQMTLRAKETGIEFWSPEEGGFTGISEDADFYINEAGNPVIVFEKYEIAPGAEGKIEFEVKEEADQEEETQTKQNNNGGYEDNFAVDSSAAAEFADKIKEAAEAKDIEALADLTFFPVYVGISEEIIETREDFIALGAETVFTPELLQSIIGADTSNLSPSMAGFSISKDGKCNIIFGVVDGKLGISGINYE